MRRPRVTGDIPEATDVSERAPDRGGDRHRTGRRHDKQTPRAHDSKEHQASGDEQHKRQAIVKRL